MSTSTISAASTTEVGNIYEKSIIKATQSQAAVDSNDRMIFLNESYRKRQAEYNMLLLYVLLGTFIFLILVAIKRIFPFIPSALMDLLILILFFITLIFVAYKFFDIQRRYKLNFDELNIPSNIALNNDVTSKETQKNIEKGKLTDLVAAGSSSSCVGASCCGADTIFDSATNKCKKI
jgi:hypothetical protein